MLHDKIYPTDKGMRPSRDKSFFDPIIHVFYKPNLFIYRTMQIATYFTYSRLIWNIILDTAQIQKKKSQKNTKAV
jgi:hypothetical protein